MPSSAGYYLPPVQVDRCGHRQVYHKAPALQVEFAWRFTCIGITIGLSCATLVQSKGRHDDAVAKIQRFIDEFRHTQPPLQTDNECLGRGIAVRTSTSCASQSQGASDEALKDAPLPWTKHRSTTQSS